MIKINDVYRSKKLSKLGLDWTGIKIGQDDPIFVYTDQFKWYFFKNKKKKYKVVNLGVLVPPPITD